MPPVFFLLTLEVPTSWANCSLYGAEVNLIYWSGPICLSFTAKACTVLQAFRWSPQHQQVYHLFVLLFSDSRSVPTTLSSLRPSFNVSFSDRSGKDYSSPPPFLSDYSGCPEHPLLPGKPRPMSWPVSSIFFDNRFPPYPPRKLRHLVTLAVTFLVFTATDTAFCKALHLSRIGRIENPSHSASDHPTQKTARLFLSSPAADSLHCSLFGNSFILYDLWSRPCRVVKLLQLHGL